MKQFAFILGNHPELSKAEIISLLPEAKIVAANNTALILDCPGLDAESFLDRLGGTIKIGEVEEQNDVTIGTPAYAKAPVSRLMGMIKDENTRLPVPEGAADGGQADKDKKIIYGFSLYGAGDRNYYHRLGINLKIELKNQGYKVRLVESRENYLSSVIVTQEKLIEQGADFLVIKIDNKIFFGKTLAVQKFKDYSFRDYSRPARDTSRGLMPPKLAKIMLNLSGANLEDSILDPFCGAGTILAEAMVMGFENITGSDVDTKAIEKTKENLAWLKKSVGNAQGWNAQVRSLRLFVCDALKISNKIKNVDYIVTETDLGPFGYSERSKKEFETLYSNVLKELKKLNPKRIVIALPAWKIQDKIIHLEISEALLGRARKFIYGREDAKVLREICILN